MGRPETALRPLITLTLLLLVVAIAAPSQAEDELEIDWPGRSVEGPGGTVVLPPQPIPPDLLLEEDARVRRTDLLLERADVLDTFVARFARQARRLLAADPPDCAALGTLESAITLARAASTDAVRTVEADLAALPSRPSLELRRERARQATERQAVVVSEAWPALESALRRRCPVSDASPTVWLPDEDRAPVDGRSVLYVRGPEPLRVVFVDGTPAGVTGSSGWAVVVARTGSVALCVAEPDEDDCLRPVRVEAAPAAAFDLSG